MTSFAKLLDEDGLGERHNVVLAIGPFLDKRAHRSVPRNGDIHFDRQPFAVADLHPYQRAVQPELRHFLNEASRTHTQAPPTRSAQNAAERDRLTQISLAAQADVAADAAAFVGLGGRLAA